MSAQRRIASYLNVGTTLITVAICVLACSAFAKSDPSQGDQAIADAPLQAANQGVQAFRAGDYRAAVQHLNDYLKVVEAIDYQSELAEESRKYSKKDEIKVFKGENHERSVAYILKALSHLSLDELSSAKAALRSASFHDIFFNIENQLMQDDDWVLPYWFLGWLEYREGDLNEANEYLQKARARSLSPNLPAYENIGRPTILLIGHGPSKDRGGKYDHLLFYRQHREDYEVIINQSGAFLLDDLFIQAATRGGRFVDFFLGRKAAISGSSAAASAAFMGLGVAVGNMALAIDSDNAAAAAGVLVLAGGIADWYSRRGSPEADIRQIENLPRHFILVPTRRDETMISVGKADYSLGRIRWVQAPIVSSGLVGVAWCN